MNLKSILCPTDFSKSSEAALRYASSLSAETGAMLYIVHVVDENAIYYPGYNGVGYVADVAEKIEHESLQLLEQLKPAVAGVPFVHRQLHGAPARALLAFADTENIDLIVLGSHGRTGVSRLLMGSVAEAVVRGAECPVLTVKRPEVAVDRSGDKPVCDVPRAVST